MAGRPEPQEWYFFKAGSDAGLKAGPFSWERLLVQAKSGSLEPNDVVWDPNSGWKTASQVPGLFPDLPPSPGMESTFADVPSPEPTDGQKKRFRWFWIGALALLVIIGVALGLYFGLAGDGEDGTDAGASVTTSLSTATSESTSTSNTSSTSGSVSTSVTGSTDGAEPAARLERSDSGNEVKLNIGERVRIELEPYVGDRVTYVFWRFRPSDPIVVRVVDSGSEVIDGVVVSAWLELEAAVAGPATIRALYEYPNGSTEAKFVAYLIVNE